MAFDTVDECYQSIGTSSYVPVTGVTLILMTSFRDHSTSAGPLPFRGDGLTPTQIGTVINIYTIGTKPAHRCMRYGDGCMLVLRIVPLHSHVPVINDQHLHGSIVAGVVVPRVLYFTREVPKIIMTILRTFEFNQFHQSLIVLLTTCETQCGPCF